MNLSVVGFFGRRFDSTASTTSLPHSNDSFLQLAQCFIVQRDSCVTKVFRDLLASYASSIGVEECFAAASRPDSSRTMRACPSPCGRSFDGYL